MKLNLTRFTFHILSITLLLTASCTITKRVHQPGYSVQWNERYTKSEVPKTHDSETTLAKENSSQKETIIRTEENVQPTTKSDKKRDRSNEKQHEEEVSESNATSSSRSNNESYERNNPTSTSDRVEETFEENTFSIPVFDHEKVNEREEIANNRGNYATTAMVAGIIAFASTIILLILWVTGFGYMFLLSGSFFILRIIRPLLLLTSLIAMIISFVAVKRSKKTEPDTDENVHRRKIGFAFSLTTLSLYLILFLLLVVLISGFSI